VGHVVAAASARSYPAGPSRSDRRGPAAARNKGSTALEALRILDGFPLPGRRGPIVHHLLIEANQRAPPCRRNELRSQTRCDERWTPAEDGLADDWIADRAGSSSARRAAAPRMAPGGGRRHARRGLRLPVRRGDGGRHARQPHSKFHFLSFGSGGHVAGTEEINLKPTGGSPSRSTTHGGPTRSPRKAHDGTTLIPRDGDARWRPPVRHFGSHGRRLAGARSTSAVARLVDDGADLKTRLDRGRRWCVRATRTGEAAGRNAISRREVVGRSSGVARDTTPSEAPCRAGWDPRTPSRRTGRRLWAVLATDPRRAEGAALRPLTCGITHGPVIGAMKDVPRRNSRTVGEPDGHPHRSGARVGSASGRFRAHA